MSAAAAAAMADELEATRQKKKSKKHRERAEVAAASSESPRPPATPDSMPESPAPIAPETLTSTAVAAGNGRKRKMQVAAASPLVQEAVRREERKKHKRSRYQEAAATPSPSAPATASQIMEMAAVRKEQRWGKVEQGQSCQALLPVDVHAQGRGAAAADGGVSVSQSIKRCSSAKIPVLSNREILRRRIIELRKKQPVSESFVPAVANPNPIDQDSSTFFDQFCYKPDRQEGRNAPSLQKTPDCPARQLPQYHLPSLSSQLTANETFKAAKTMTLNTKQPHSASVSRPQASVLHPQEVAVASSESPRSPATPDPMPESPAPITHETLISTAVVVGKGRKTKKQVAEPSPLVEEAVRKEGREKHKRSGYQEAVATPSPSAPATAAQILEMAAARKEQRRGKVEQGQSCQALLPVDVHAQGRGAAAADGGVSVSQSIKRCSGGKIPLLSDREILRRRIIELRKKQPVSESFVPAMANPNPIDQDSSTFFDQFCYKPDRQEGRNAPPLPKTPDRPARPLPRNLLPSLSPQLTANKTFVAAKTTTLNTKQPRAASVSCPQEEIKIKEQKRSEKKISETKKPRKKSPLLSAAEKRSDKYRRLPLNQLVRPPRSQYNLLQEKYASDPWKVIVICMLLNVSKGDQVKKILKGFFKRYPDAQTAYTADPEIMAKYLAPLGLQRVKANRIQRFSKAYVEEEWTYITELCGVGKYAADAYAIFCAGRATEVVPEDHMLVVYWKFVCNLSLTQASQKEQQSAGAD